MLSKNFEKVADYFNIDRRTIVGWEADEEFGHLSRLEEATHEIVHLYLCQGHLNTHTVDSTEIDEIVHAKYPTSYQRDLHELRTSLVTAFTLQSLVKDCPQAIEIFCFESAEGNIDSDLDGQKHYDAMKLHKINQVRALAVAEFLRQLQQVLEQDE